MFQSTRPVRGATFPEMVSTGGYNLVSIHAPRAGRDINPPASNASRTVFQSTRPVRGATLISTTAPGARGVSIHAPRAGRDTGSRRA